MLQKQRQVRWSLLLQSASQEGIRDGSDDSSNRGHPGSAPCPAIVRRDAKAHNGDDGDHSPKVIILSTLQTLSHLGLAAPLYFSTCPHYTDRTPETQRKLSRSVVELGFKPVRGSLEPVLLTYPLPPLSDPHLSPAAGGSL